MKCETCPYYREALSWVRTPYRRGWMAKGKGVDCVALPLKLALHFGFITEQQLRSAYSYITLLKFRRNAEKLVDDIARMLSAKVGSSSEALCGDWVGAPYGRRFEVVCAMKIGSRFVAAYPCGVLFVDKFPVAYRITWGGLECPGG